MSTDYTMRMCICLQKTKGMIKGVQRNQLKSKKYNKLRKKKRKKKTRRIKAICLTNYPIIYQMVNNKFLTRKTKKKRNLASMMSSTIDAKSSLPNRNMVINSLICLTMSSTGM